MGPFQSCEVSPLRRYIPKKTGRYLAKCSHFRSRCRRTSIRACRISTIRARSNHAKCLLCEDIYQKRQVDISQSEHTFAPDVDRMSFRFVSDLYHPSPFQSCEVSPLRRYIPKKTGRYLAK